MVKIQGFAMIGSSGILNCLGENSSLSKLLGGIKVDKLFLN